jgi:hypothetical protein
VGIIVSANTKIFTRKDFMTLLSCFERCAEEGAGIAAAMALFGRCYKHAFPQRSADKNGKLVVTNSDASNCSRTLSAVVCMIFGLGVPTSDPICCCHFTGPAMAKSDSADCSTSVRHYYTMLAGITPPCTL